MTTDTTALQERIARVLHEIDPISGHGHDWRKLSDAERKFYIRKAAAIFPIIAAEVRAAKADAWDEGYGDCWNYHQSNGLAGTYRNPYRTAEQETGHDDER